MRLLKNGFSTAETTMAGTTAGAGEAAVAGSGQYGPGGWGLRVQKIVAFSGGSTVAPNTSGGLHFRYGDSSNAILSTLVILPMSARGEASSAATPPLIPQPTQVTLDGLNIQCNWFEAASQEAATGGWGIFVFGD